MKDCYRALKSTGTELSHIMAIGGGSVSGLWLQTLSNTLDLPIQLPDKGDFGAAMGAARLAMAGDPSSCPEEFMIQPDVVATIEPQPMKVGVYESAYQRFVKGYSALKEIQ